MTINAPNIGGFSPQAFILGAPKGLHPAPAPAPEVSQINIPAGSDKPGAVPVFTDRPGGAPFHAGGPPVVLPGQTRDRSVMLTARPITENPAIEKQNAVLEQAQTNNTEMLGILLDRFA